MLTSRTIAIGIIKAMGISVLALLLLYLLYEIRAAILYLIISLIFTLIANPIVEFLKRRFKFSNILAVITTLLLFVLIIVGLVLLFVPLILSQGANLSVLNTKDVAKKLNELITLTSDFLARYNIDSGLIFNQKHWLAKFNIEFFTDFLNSILNILGNLGIGIVSVFFISFFFLKDKEGLLAGAKTLLPKQHEKKIIHSSVKIYGLLSRYFTGLVLQLLIIFILYIIVLLVLGIENAFIIAFLCALLNIVPYLGPIISAILAAILTMLNHIDEDFQTEIIPSTLYVILGFLLVQFIDNNFSAPLIFSKSVKSHPLEIFIVILISGLLFGILGMIIGIPVYTMLKVISKEFLPNNKLVMLLTKNI